MSSVGFANDICYIIVSSSPFGQSIEANHVPKCIKPCHMSAK